MKHLDGHDIPAVTGVYLLTSELDATTYVGASKNIRKRVHEHFSEMSCGNFAGSPYRQFRATFEAGGTHAFSVTVLEQCSIECLREREKHWMGAVRPTANQYDFCAAPAPYTDEERQQKSERVKQLWADPQYRERAVAARKGKAYNKGYVCTPEQVENRRRAARISMMKRWYSSDWKNEYLRRYPEHAGDVS